MGAPRLELGTSALSGLRSNQLSYAPGTILNDSTRGKRIILECKACASKALWRHISSGSPQIPQTTAGIREIGRCPYSSPFCLEAVTRTVRRMAQVDRIKDSNLPPEVSGMRLHRQVFSVAVGITFVAGAATAAWAADSLSPSRALAQGLTFTPVQSQVEYTIPKKDEANKCTIQPEKEANGTAWVVRSGSGQILRRFADTNNDNVVDLWCYYLDGIEVYRDIDSNFNKKADQYRWFNTAGTRWGLDRERGRPHRRVADDLSARGGRASRHGHQGARSSPVQPAAGHAE